MGMQKVSEFENYKFQELKRDLNNSDFHGKTNVFKEAEFKDVTPPVDDLVAEVDRATAKDFEIDSEVFKLRELKNAKKMQADNTIDERVRNAIDNIKEKAYQEGLMRGRDEGRKQAYQEEYEATQNKIREVQDLVDNLLSRQEELIQTQDQKFAKLFRDLVKWVALKEIEKDDKYILRLISKINEENKKTDKITFQLGRGVVASFKESITKVNQSLNDRYNGKVEIVENSQIEKDAIEIELDSNILRANLSEQLEVYDKLFEDFSGD